MRLCICLLLIKLRNIEIFFAPMKFLCINYPHSGTLHRCCSFLLAVHLFHLAFYGIRPFDASSGSFYSTNAHNSFTRHTSFNFRARPGNLSDNLIFFAVQRNIAKLFALRPLFICCLHKNAIPRNEQNIVPAIVYHSSFDEEFCKTTWIFGAA